MSNFKKNLKYFPILILPLGCVGITSGFQAIAIIVFLYCLLKEKEQYGYKAFFADDAVRRSLIFIFLWLLCVTVSDLISKENMRSLKATWNYLERMLPFFCVGFFAVYDKKFQKFAWAGLCVGMLFANFDVFYNLVLQGHWRPRTIFSNPNRLGAFIIMLLPFIVCGTYQFRKNRFAVLIGGFLSVLGLISLVISGSRGAMLGLMGGCLFAFIIFSIRQGDMKKVCKRLLSGVVLICCIIGITYYFYPGMVARSYDMERVYLWQSSLKMIADYPLWGVGEGNFNRIYINNGYVNPLARELTLPHPHNTYLYYFVERGIFVGSAFILMILSQIYVLSKNLLTKDKNINMFVFAGLIMVFGVVIQGFVDVTFDNNRIYQLMYWLLYGLVCYSIVFNGFKKSI